MPNLAVERNEESSQTKIRHIDELIFYQRE